MRQLGRAAPYGEETTLEESQQNARNEAVAGETRLPSDGNGNGHDGAIGGPPRSAEPLTAAAVAAAGARGRAETVARTALATRVERPRLRASSAVGHAGRLLPVDQLDRDLLQVPRRHRHVHLTELRPRRDRDCVDG